MSIGENLRRLREQQNLTQTELAERVRVSAPMISQLERGTRTLSLPLGQEIANILNCRLDDLLDYDSMISDIVSEAVRETRAGA